MLSRAFSVSGWDGGTVCPLEAKRDIAVKRTRCAVSQGVKSTPG